MMKVNLPLILIGLSILLGVGVEVVYTQETNEKLTVMSDVPSGKVIVPPDEEEDDDVNIDDI